jgi:hypothetical protein
MYVVPRVPPHAALRRPGLTWAQSGTGDIAAVSCVSASLRHSGAEFKMDSLQPNELIFTMLPRVMSSAPSAYLLAAPAEAAARCAAVINQATIETFEARAAACALRRAATGHSRAGRSCTSVRSLTVRSARVQVKGCLDLRCKYRFLGPDGGSGPTANSSDTAVAGTAAATVDTGLIAGLAGAVAVVMAAVVGVAVRMRRTFRRLISRGEIHRPRIFAVLRATSPKRHE